MNLEIELNIYIYICISSLTMYSERRMIIRLTTSIRNMQHANKN